MSTISCQQRQFGTLETGQTITCYSLRNTSGMKVSILNYGAILNAVQIPDLRGEMHEITLGPSQLSDLKDLTPSGSTTIHLPPQYGITFNELKKTIWEAENITQDTKASVKLSHQGTLDLKYSVKKLEYQCTVEYTLTDANEIIICSQIKTSVPLPVFVTHHPIWHLAGKETKEINNYVLQVWSSQYSSVDKTGLVNSNFLDISDQPAFNFQQPQRIGEKYAQIPKEVPYDVCFKLKEQEDDAFSTTKLAAYVKAPVSGRILEVYTNQPGLHFYLKSSEQNALEGFCINPMQLLTTSSSKPSASLMLQQETRYKMTW